MFQPVYSTFFSDTTKKVLTEEFYLKTLKRDDTKRSYLSSFNEFADYIQKDILTVSYDDCSRYINHLNSLRDNNITRTSTVQKKRKQLSSLFTYVCKYREKFGLDESFYNFFLNIAAEETNTIFRYERVPKVAELNDLYLHLLNNDPMTCIAFLLAFKGFLTLEEFRNLKTSDFYQDSQNHLVVQVINTLDTKDIHYNSIPEDAAEIIYKYFDSLYTKYPTYSDIPLFSKNGRIPLTPNAFRNRLNKALKKLELPHFTFNDLRNAGSVYAIAYHADTKLVANSLGHKTERHIKKLDSLVFKVNDAANYIGIQFKGNTDTK